MGRRMGRHGWMDGWMYICPVIGRLVLWTGLSTANLPGIPPSSFSPGCRNHRPAEFRSVAGKQVLGTGGWDEADRIWSILGYI